MFLSLIANVKSMDTKRAAVDPNKHEVYHFFPTHSSSAHVYLPLGISSKRLSDLQANFSNRIFGHAFGMPMFVRLFSQGMVDALTRL